MNKGLEALNHLFDVVCSECKYKFYKNGIECSNQCNIPETVTSIKKALVMSAFLLFVFVVFHLP